LTSKYYNYDKSKIYRENNKEKMKQYHVDYYQKNSDKIKKKQINNYYLNIAKFKGYHNKYYQKNKIRINEVNKKTRKLNKKKLLDEFILKRRDICDMCCHDDFGICKNKDDIIVKQDKDSEIIRCSGFYAEINVINNLFLIKKKELI
jgi:hypothetical protein